MIQRLRLLKIPVSLFSAIAAFFGFFAVSGRISFNAFLIALSVFILAGGSAVLNNYQDRKIDCLMKRTRYRPIPSGGVPPVEALAISIVFLSAGIILLAIFTQSLLTVSAGIFAVILYNAIYTPLKKITSLSFFPGILCGMLSPFIGFSAAGGDPFSVRIWYIMILFGIWQIPHIWILLLLHKDDYSRISIPTIIDHISGRIVNKILFIWFLFFSISTMFVIIFLHRINGFLYIIIQANAVILSVMFFYKLILKKDRPALLPLFHYLNASLFIIIICVIINSLF